MRCVWIRNVYNTGPNWYLSEVWLEQAKRRRKGNYTQFPVCEPNAWNGDFYQIRPREDEVIVTKHRYDAFIGTDLEVVLRAASIRTVIVCGVTTNFCVESTARHAFCLDYYVVVPSDAVAHWDPSAHEAALKNIEYGFGQVSTVGELLGIWKDPA